MQIQTSDVSPCAAMIALVRECVKDDGLLKVDHRGSPVESVGFIVGKDVCVFLPEYDSDEYRLERVAMIEEMLADYREIHSTAMNPDAASKYTAYALVPIEGHQGLFQVAKMSISGSRVTNVERFDRHQPEMLHFALHKLFEAVRADVERNFDESNTTADETLTAVVEDKPVARAPERAEKRAKL